LDNREDHMVWAKLFGAPTTQHEADVMALRLFFVFLLLLAGLISAGMCLAKTALGTAA
jgi:hypothetical protein